MVRNVNLNQIDISDDKYLITCPVDFQAVKLSIEKAGLLSPPFLEKIDNDRYRIITGFKRIYAVAELGRTLLNAVISEKTEKDNALILLYDNMTHRRFNPAEKGLIVSLLSKYFSKEEIIDNCLHLAGITPSVKALEHYILIDSLSEFKSDFASGLLNEWIAEGLAEFDLSDAKEIVSLFRKLKPGTNIQREIVENLLDLYKGEGKRPSDIIKSEMFKESLKDESKNDFQKSELIKREVKKLRYPKLTEMEDNFNRFKKNLKLPQNVKLMHPEAFEGGKYKLTLEFKRLSELLNSLETLNRISKQEEWELFLQK